MKKLVYLISPNKIDQNFFASLDKVLSFNNVKFFQLRLKNLSQKKLLNFSKRIIKITTKHKVKFIINDNFILASKINADGCHMGQHDGSFLKARKKLKNKIFGVTCHNSKKLAVKAIKNNASYIAFLSGGQPEIASSKNLNEINKINDSNFLITFSYGRRLQASALKEFGKNQENTENIQKAFNHRAKMNGLSSKGEWSEELEKEFAA